MRCDDTYKKHLEHHFFVFQKMWISIIVSRHQESDGFVILKFHHVDDVCHYPEPRDAFCIHPIFDSRYGLYRSFSGDVSAISWGKLQEYGYKNGFHGDLAGFAVFLEEVALMLTPFEDEFMHIHIDGKDYTVVVSEVTACDGSRPKIVLEFPEMLGGNSNYEGCTSFSQLDLRDILRNSMSAGGTISDDLNAAGSIYHYTDTSDWCAPENMPNDKARTDYIKESLLHFYWACLLQERMETMNAPWMRRARSPIEEDYGCVHGFPKREVVKEG